MHDLLTALSTKGISEFESEMSLLTIEEWLQEKYPILAQLFHNEFVKKLIAVPEIYQAA